MSEMLSSMDKELILFFGIFIGVAVVTLFDYIISKD